LPFVRRLCNIRSEPGGSRQGAFVKLSTRSPKDASLNMTKTYDYIRARLKESKLRLTSDGKITKEIVREDLSLINEACANVIFFPHLAHAVLFVLT